MPPRRRGRQPDVRPPLKGISKFAPKLCPPLHALVFLSSSLLPVRLVPSISDGDSAILALLPRSVFPSVRPSLSPTHISPTLTFMVMTSNERTKKEGGRRRARRREGRTRFRRRTMGIAVQTMETETEGDMGGRDGAPFHARYIQPG